MCIRDSSECDLVIALGVDFDFRLKYGEGISNEAIIITIDPDKDKLDWNIKPTVSINNSLDLILNKL